VTHNDQKHKKKKSLQRNDKKTTTQDKTQIGLHNIAENLSRFTTHDAPLTTGINQNILKTETLDTGFPSGHSFPPTDPLLNQQTTGWTGQTTGFTGQTTGFTGQTTGFTGQNFSDRTYADRNLTKEVPSLGSHIPITQENEFLGRETGTQFGSEMPVHLDQMPLTTGQMPLQTGQFPVQSNLTTIIPPTNLTTEMPIRSTAEDLTGETHEKKPGFLHKVTGIFKGKHKTDDMQDEDVETHEKKPGLLSKVTGIFKGHKKEKVDDHHNIEKLRAEPPGILDEKGTTVSMAQGLSSTSQLGLPVTGPDYTHGTHGTTTHTVFTGGYPTNTGFDAFGNRLIDAQHIGPGSNVATLSGPVSLTRGDFVEPGFENFGTQFDQVRPVQGIDLSGANASHVDRDITLQEGGLLGLRQGAVTGNPGDIITNYEPKGELIQPKVITTLQQPVFTSVETIQQPIFTGTTNPTGLGTDCSLVRGHQNNQF